MLEIFKEFFDYKPSAREKMVDDALTRNKVAVIELRSKLTDSMDLALQEFRKELSKKG